MQVYLFWILKKGTEEKNEVSFMYVLQISYKTNFPKHREKPMNKSQHKYQSLGSYRPTVVKDNL
jgi:hypothetical protein